MRHLRDDLGRLFIQNPCCLMMSFWIIYTNQDQLGMIKIRGVAVMSFHEHDTRKNGITL